MNRPKRTLPAPLDIKRLIDLMGATLSLLVLSPVLWVIVLLIWLESRGPVLRGELRRGYRGRLFETLRFRTTVDGGEQDFGGEDPGTASSSAQLVGQRDSPHVTRVGQVLRRLSLHVLPELFNVVRGEMSLVGPPPLSIADSDRLREEDPRAYLDRLEVMPGVTEGWHIARPDEWNHSQ